MTADPYLGRQGDKAVAKARQPSVTAQSDTAVPAASQPSGTPQRLLWGHPMAGLPRSNSHVFAASSSPRAPRRRANTDTVKLLMLGYRQELAREFTLFNTFGSGINALGAMAGLAGGSGVGYGFTYGGPAVMMWGWLVVMLFSTSVGLSMAELASAYPTSGALYYWSFRLAPPRLRTLAAWTTGWVLTLGQAAFTASILFTAVEHIQSAVLVHLGFTFNAWHRFAVLMVQIVVVGLLNCGSARLTAFVTTLGAFWHLLAMTALSLTLLVVAPERQSAKYVFTTWQTFPETTGISNPVYITLIGLLMSQWIFTGYDGCAHVAEETIDAEINVPYAILAAIGGAGVTGYLFLIACNFIRMDESIRYDPTTSGNVVIQLMLQLTTDTSSSASASASLFSIVVVAGLFSSFQAVANNSRMLYAFARDHGVPFSRLGQMVQPGTQGPVCGVVYMLVLAAALSVPMCFNPFVFSFVTSYAVIACYAAYALPVLCKLSTGRRFFLPGPFYLGPWRSYINNVISAVWVLAIAVLCTLPIFYPVTLENCNWSGPMLVGSIVLVLGWYYFPYIGAYKWFTGPRTNLGQFKDLLPSERSGPSLEPPPHRLHQPEKGRLEDKVDKRQDVFDEQQQYLNQHDEQFVSFQRD